MVSEGLFKIAFQKSRLLGHYFKTCTCDVCVEARDLKRRHEKVIRKVKRFNRAVPNESA